MEKNITGEKMLSHIDRIAGEKKPILLLGPFTGEQKDWNELERWVDTVNKIIYDLQKNRQ